MDYLNNSPDTLRYIWLQVDQNRMKRDSTYTITGTTPAKKTGKKTCSRRTKYGLVRVVIHEVGHNYFPMIVNSDER